MCIRDSLNAVQFRAVRGQKVKRESLLLQEGQQGLDGLGLVDGRIVQNDRQGSANALQQRPRKPPKRAAVVVSQNLAVNNSPVEISAASTFRRFPRSAVMR